MKKIFTLAMMAFVFCLSASAQIELGDIKFSLGEGKKISPTTGKILVLFPNVAGVDDPVNTNFVIEGSFSAEGVEPSEFDGIEESFAKGVTLELADFELAPSTDYTLTITSVKVNGINLAPAEGYVLHFKTRSAERKMAWSFAIDEDTKAKIIADDGNDPAYNESNGGTFWKCIKADERHYVHQSLKDSEIMLDANTPFPMTEDLTFNAGSDKMFVGDLSGSFKGMLVFNATNLKMTIPDCKIGDVITFSGVNATKGNSSKQTCIYTYGNAIAPDGIESSRGVKDSVWVSAKGTFRFESQVDGDIDFYFGNFRMTGIEITEAQPKVARNYNIVAQYQPEEGEPVFLKELLAKTEGMTGSTIKTKYPYWLVDEEGNAYTHGTLNNEYLQAFDLKNGEANDTTFAINYAKTDYTGVVYCIEGEDIEGAVECTHANVAIRASMGKAGYVTEDTKLVTLQPGTYKIRMLVFDNTGKSSQSVVTLTKGAGEENEIYFTAKSDNQTEVESDLLTITEATDITLLPGGGDGKGVDAILIYVSVDAPDDPEGIVEVKSAQKVAVRKVMKDGRILIQTEAGIFNAIGVQVK